MILSGKFRETRQQIETDWSFSDMAEAHEALDYTEDTQVLIDQRLRPPDKPR